MATMRAAVVREFGKPLTINEVFARLAAGEIEGRVVLDL